MELCALGSEVISTEKFLLRNWGQLGLPSKLPYKLAYHHGCRAQETELAKVLGLDPAPGQCCGMSSGEYDLAYNHEVRSSEVRKVKAMKSDFLLADCVSCREKFLPYGKETGIEVTDLVSLAVSLLREKGGLSSLPG